MLPVPCSPIEKPQDDLIEIDAVLNRPAAKSLYQVHYGVFGFKDVRSAGPAIALLPRPYTHC